MLLLVFRPTLVSGKSPKAPFIVPEAAFTAPAANSSSGIVGSVTTVLVWEPEGKGTCTLQPYLLVVYSSVQVFSLKLLVVELLPYILVHKCPFVPGMATLPWPGRRLEVV